ncbi:FtsW/RodA/SpoVE family cell cycle protein [Adlercreutzia sp. ZJ141]|uniref:FtsW/RodA/SpoVE family cell cycle protein n=1 Tax=Adlercreutzia sp. ZJ141 TaxID=2709406 RepID=UPI0013EC9DF0|nr:FtsW/RodA/SpoVE family cell cycle protein [Adlercreutzia sp. ZJ141]
MTRRNLELVLLCIAAPVVLLPYAMLALNQGQSLSVSTLGVPLGLLASFCVAHLAARRFTPDADPAILPLVFALSGIGIAFVTRLAPELAVNQVLWLFVAIAGMVVVMALSRNLDNVARYPLILIVLGLLLLLSPLLPVIGMENYGSRIWLNIAGFSFQPGEVAKVVIVLFLAGYLAENREMLSVFTGRLGPFHLPDVRTLLPLLLMWGVAMLIVVGEKDLGSALVFFFVFLIMLYVATGKKFYLVVGLLLIAIGGVGAYLMFDHVQIRVQTWLDPFADAQNTGYQLVQAIYSIADGDLFGVGIGNGLADQIPVVESDFIFASIAEEIGLLGAAGVLLLFLCLAVRGCVTAARAKSDVSSFIAVGVTSIIVLQAFIIVGGVTRVIPLTGLTLPFISQGGSSLLASFISVGLLMRCGDDGTGVGREMAMATMAHSKHSDSVLGRISVGKRLTNVMIIFALMFALLVANLTMIMVVDAQKYQDMPGNNHTMVKQSKTERGTISTYDGVVLAQSVQQDDGTYDRVYPSGDLAAHVVGYTSDRFGSSGIEASQNDVLQGQRGFASWTDVLNSFAGIGGAGNDVELTINSTVQQAAQNALAGEKGACVVIDPTTGAVLGMASSPTYDAAQIESLLEAAGAGADDGSGTLLNRATQTLYAPGSTFKIVSLATAFENNIASEDTLFASPGSMDIGGAKVSNYEGESYGDITLEQATWYSSNTVFGQLGEQMGAEMLVEGADSFGFDENIPFDVPLAMSLMADPANMSVWGTAWAAAGEPVGQRGPNATVMQMALVGCAIANDGAIMQPYLVNGVYNANGERSSTTQPSKLMQAVSETTAERVREVLKGVVTNGTGYAAAIQGVEVAGKTGTAEKADGSDSWFVGMAPADNPSVVVAIVIEKGDTGEGAQKAQSVLSETLRVQGAL